MGANHMRNKIDSSNEHNHQVGLLFWFRTKYPDTLCFAIPNGSWRDIRTAKKLKDEGVTRGIPDLYIPRYHLWIEVKTPIGKLSKEQIEMHRYLISIGDFVIVAMGAEDGSRKILSFLSQKPKQL